MHRLLREPNDIPPLWYQVSWPPCIELHPERFRCNLVSRMGVHRPRSHAYLWPGSTRRIASLEHQRANPDPSNAPS